MSELVNVGPKTTAVARKLLAAAEVAGLSPKVVLTTIDGFTAPQEVVDIYEGKPETAEPETAPRKTKAKEKPKADEPKKEGAE